MLVDLTMSDAPDGAVTEQVLPTRTRGELGVPHLGGLSVSSGVMLDKSKGSSQAP